MHLLGIKAEPVCDHPLAVMDASILQPQHGRSNRIFIDLHVHTVTNLKGEISHGPDQKRYYYPDQTANEVLVFSHYHKNQKGRRTTTPTPAPAGQSPWKVPKSILSGFAPIKNESLSNCE
ncbi:hypothetical protein ACA910_015515 [Epithemia clementina (nom. ined.)]